MFLQQAERDHRRSTLRREIKSKKTILINRAKKKGIYEYFGDKEERQLEDAYGLWKWDDKEIGEMFMEFWEWRTNFDLAELSVHG